MAKTDVRNMTQHFYRLLTVFTVIFLFYVNALAVPESPHDESNEIGCLHCHTISPNEPILSRGAAQEAKCKTCHNPSGQASLKSNVGNHIVNNDTIIIDCGSCHEIHVPQPTTNAHSGQTFDNEKLIRSDTSKYADEYGISDVEEPAVFHDNGSGSYTYAFESAPYNGICQSCHNNTAHHTNYGMDTQHGSGVACTTCHGHGAGFVHDDVGGGGGGDSGCGSTTECHGIQKSHPTHLQSFEEGGMLGVGCDDCHDTTNMPNFADGATLATTLVCDNCHSPDGSYDGVNDLAYGAKINFEYGVYHDSLLSQGRDKWCAGCHDEDPSEINSVAAPNVIGDEDADTYYGTDIGYGYYKTGHGLPTTDTYPASGGVTPGAGMLCTECHDRNMAHVDGEARTYDASALDGDPNDYQHGYRLKSVDGDIPMDIPRDPNFNGGGYRIWADESHYRLCLKCHDLSQYLVNYDPEDPGATTTNFFDLSMDRGFVNMHNYHVNTAGPSANAPRYNSDYDLVIGHDSRISCPACHNVHGSNYLAMMRDGKLVGKEPGMPTFYTNADTVISGNDWGGCGKPEDTGVTLGESTGATYNGRAQMCMQCHGGCWLPYDRAPTNYADGNDADRDGTMDSADSCPVDFQGTQGDGDGDGWGDVCDLCPADPSNVNDTSVDTDFDGIGDNCDVCPDHPINDPDGDGLCESDICPYDFDDDFDNDGICGDVDNCPSDSNVSQGDVDSDGVGNACDNCPDDYNPDQIDSYGDGTGDACGPGLVTLHPSGVVDGTVFDILGSDPWESALDSNDGDRSLAYNVNNTETVSVLSVSMDDTAGTFLEGATIESIRIYTYARYISAGSGIPVDGSIDVGYNTGSSTVWNGNTVFAWPNWDYSYILIESSVFTTDSDGGSLDPTDIDNLQIMVQRNSKNNVWQMLVTEVYVEVYYAP